VQPESWQFREPPVVCPVSLPSRLFTGVPLEILMGGSWASAATAARAGVCCEAGVRSGCRHHETAVGQPACFRGVMFGAVIGVATGPFVLPAGLFLGQLAKDRDSQASSRLGRIGSVHGFGRRVVLG